MLLRYAVLVAHPGPEEEEGRKEVRGCRAFSRLNGGFHDGYERSVRA
jgi:hypothetical protein